MARETLEMSEDGRSVKIKLDGEVIANLEVGEDGFLLDLTKGCYDFDYCDDERMCDPPYVAWLNFTVEPHLRNVNGASVYNDEASAGKPCEHCGKPMDKYGCSADPRTWLKREIRAK